MDISLLCSCGGSEFDSCLFHSLIASVLCIVLAQHDLQV